MRPPASRLRAAAHVIAGALVADAVVYLGVLVADATAAGQPAQQITCDGSDAAAAGLPGCDAVDAQQMSLSRNGFAVPRTAGKSAGVLVRVESRKKERTR